MEDGVKLRAFMAELAAPFKLKGYGRCVHAEVFKPEAIRGEVFPARLCHDIAMGVESFAIECAGPPD